MKILLILLVITFSNKSYTQQNNFDSVVSQGLKQLEWYFIGESDEYEKWYINMNTAKNTPEGLKVWVKITMPTITMNKKIYKNAVVKWLQLIDCDNFKVKRLMFVLYSSTGKLVKQINDFDEEFKDVIPESTGGNLVTKACRLFKEE